jgi:peroxiredoxin
MVANICLLTCALLAGQSADRSEWWLAPHLHLGHELVYQGTFTEQTLGPAVQFNRAYRLESRVFVLDVSLRGLEAAFQTILKLRTPTAERGIEPEPSSVRLELAHVDTQGALTTAPSLKLTLPLDGPPTLETGAFIALPRGLLRVGQSWETAVEPLPPQIWKVVGSEVVGGFSCIKLEGLQQSADWDRPRADHTAWRRRDVVWLSPRLGVAQQVERTIEHRAPAHDQPTHRSVARYELQRNLEYPGQLFADRRQDILQEQRFYQSIAPYLSEPTRYGPKPFEAMIEKITQHLNSHPPTPYREALLQLKRRVEMARRGESPPAPPGETDADVGVASTVGQRAPDFVASDLLHKGSVGLRHWAGKPVLLIFYSPTSKTVEEVLRFGQRIQDAHGKSLGVVGLAITEDVEGVRKQHEELHLTLPILSGKGLRISYAVDATPKLFVLDGDGIIHGSYAGWGPEMPDAIRADLKTCLDKPARPRSGIGMKTTSPTIHP